MMELVTRPMMVRSVLTSVLVGGLLFAINHQRSALAPPWSPLLWRQLGMSMVVPFVVSLSSAVLTRRELIRAGGATPRAGRGGP